LEKLQVSPDSNKYRGCTLSELELQGKSDLVILSNRIKRPQRDLAPAAPQTLDGQSDAPREPIAMDRLD
jgi:hypothetical protein